MNHMSPETHTTPIESDKGQVTMESSNSSKGAVLFKGVATGVTTAIAAATIVQTGKGVMTTFTRHPLVMFSLGIAAGYFAHKHRKRIISITSNTVEQSKDFVLRQKENLKDLLAETQESAGEEDASK